ncbi:MAG: type II toxin-antitoxin system prevent-host-death family antitoxin [Spirochaetales bacterium]
MDAVSYSDLRQNLKTYLDRVYNDHDPLIVTRKNSENLVILSVAEYNSLLETAYLLSSKANSDHLKRSVDQWKSGRTLARELLKDD